MTEGQLRELLSEEALAWAERPYEDIVADLTEPRKYKRGAGESEHNFEVKALESTSEYILVSLSVDDGSLIWSLAPITASFLIYRDGRIEM